MVAVEPSVRSSLNGECFENVPYFYGTGASGLWIAQREKGVSDGLVEWTQKPVVLPNGCIVIRRSEVIGERRKSPRDPDARPGPVIEFEKVTTSPHDWFPESEQDCREETGLGMLSESLAGGESLLIAPHVLGFV